MIDLVARQIQILRAIIEEFIETGEPVGSETIDKKYNIGVSPATIRNEMVYLTKQGYLIKSHISSGRVPTALAMKLYINELVKEKELSVADEVSVKEKIWKYRDKMEDLLYETTRILADKTHALGIAMTEDGRMYHAGYANLLQMPEFYDINLTRQVLQMIEEETVMSQIFARSQSENAVKVIFGQDLGNKNLDQIGILFIDIPEENCRIAVLGSTRFDYSYALPMMKYFKGLIESMID
ncbi:Heat-inducible transcription repressor HrcA [bioreactor metagenome]|jgi:heat-inducible transcriptional repressor|uniref:Heat-inducible transcription repressor HrcA n=1 Tax=bioreactor metagenome TaxID=1076179 RepID=A0A644ZV76_9ZZZZ